MGFKNLAAYCTDSVEHQVILPRGYNSLKWLIYKLRDQIDGRELEEAFSQILDEAKKLGESYLYYSITGLPTYAQYKHLVRHTSIDWTRFPVVSVGAYRVLINETEQHLTGLAFTQDRCDVIVFRNPELQSAGIVVRRDVDGIDMKLLCDHIQQQDPTSVWVRRKNMVRCGGPTRPKHTTEMSIETLVMLLRKSGR